MENKPNNEISELLARLQQKVDKKPEPKVDSVKKTEEASAEELLSLLKKNIGTDESSAPIINEEYDIKGYEFEEEPMVEGLDEEIVAEIEEESSAHSAEEEEILHSKVEELVMESLEAEEVHELLLHTVDADGEPSRKEIVIEEPCDEVAPEEESSIAECEGESDADEVLPTPVEEEALAEDAEGVFEPLASAELVSDFVDGELLNETETEETVKETVEDVVGESIEEAIAETVGFCTAEEVTAEEISSKEAPMLEDDIAKLCLRASVAKKFFNDNGDENADTLENDFPEAVDFDDVDINLALALGSREALEESVGYFRVRSAKKRIS